MPLLFQSGVGLSETASNRLSNIGLTASVGSNALTITLTDAAGNTPAQTAIPPVQIGFRSSTATSGLYNVRTVSAATSIVIPSGTTIGTSNSVQAYICVYALDNAGTVELAVSLSGTFDEGALVSTTAVSGGSSATTLYSTTARTSVPLRLIGRVSISEATAGTWASAPTEVSPWPFRQGRQIVVGTAVTSSGTTTSASYAALGSNNPSVTFTAVRTGPYRIHATFAVANNGAAGTACYGKIAASSGSPTTLMSQESVIQTPATNYDGTIVPYLIAQLTAGTSYTFRGEFKTSAGTLTLDSANVSGGHALIAEEL